MDIGKFLLVKACLQCEFREMLPARVTRLDFQSDKDDQLGDKNQNPNTSMDQNLTPKKSNAEFPSHQKFPESIKIMI